MIYLTLFGVAFISATLFPLGSEALLFYDISLDYNLFLLWSFATMGNSLGSMVNYYLGLKGEAYLEEKVNISAVKLAKAKNFFDTYGGYTILFSWLPLIGDSFTFVAGILKYDIKKFIILSFLAKGGRYGVLIWLAT